MYTNNKTTDIKPNPTIENVQTGVEKFKASGADCIVAIGGGSAMDTAKGISIIMTNPDREDVVSLNGLSNTKNKGLPVIALPTTHGTAAEVTPIRSIDHRTIGIGKRGPISEKIQTAFFDIVEAKVEDKYEWLTYI